MEKMDILGIRLDNVSLQEVLVKSTDFIASNNQHFIVTPNPEFLVAAQRDLKFKEILNYADIAVADGFGLIVAAKFLHKKLVRVTGVDLVWNLADLAAEQRWPIYLLGGADEVAKQAAAALKTNFSKLVVAGAQSGGLIADPEAPYPNIIADINRVAPKILLVALGQIKQEKWIFSHLDQLPSVKIAIGVGGTFNYLAGVTPRPPKIIQQLGLEWLYRLVSQPWRWKRIVTAVIIFPLLVVKEKILKSAANQS